MRRSKNALFILAIAIGCVIHIAACDGASTGPKLPAGVEVAVIINSTDVSATIVPLDSTSAARTIGLNPGGAGSPVSAAARQNLVVVPLGFFPAAAVINLESDSLYHVPLPTNSGATGVAFLNDSIAYVANPNLNTVSAINVFAGDTVGPQIAVGAFPTAVAVRGAEVFVINAELVNFVPARESRVSVIDANTNTVVDSIVLSGFNSTAATFAPDGNLYVVNSGNFGAGDGSVSVVNTGTRQELARHAGFGEFPGSIVADANDRIFVSAFAYGIAIWDAAADSFIRPPGDPLVVAGQSTSSGLGLDSAGQLYTLIPGDCIAPSFAVRLQPDLREDIQILTGGCPFAIVFGEVSVP